MDKPLLEYRREPRLRDLTPEEWSKILKPRWRSAVGAFALAVALLGSAQADERNAGAIVVTLNEQHKSYRNSGTIILRDPFEDRILGEYKFVSGGNGRGSAPFGTYEIGAYRDDPGTSFMHDPQDFRRRWMIRQVGLEDGEAYDRDEKRNLLELHSVHASGSTAGCLGVVGDARVWDEFVRNLEYLRSAVGALVFDITGNPDGTAESVLKLAAKHHKTKLAAKHHKTQVAAKHKRHHHKVAKCSCSYVAVET